MEPGTFKREKGVMTVLELMSVESYNALALRVST
jgi:hypothetical protein